MANGGYTPHSPSINPVITGYYPVFTKYRPRFNKLKDFSNFMSAGKLQTLLPELFFQPLSLPFD